MYARYLSGRPFRAALIRPVLSVFTALLFCATFTCPLPAKAADDGTLPAFLLDRERRSGTGCDGAPVTPPPSLIPSETLRTLAGRAVDTPGSFQEFASVNGLRGLSTFFAVVDGATAQDAVARLKSGYCPQIHAPEFTHVGVQKVQGRWAVLLAAGEPQVVPAYTPGEGAGVDPVGVPGYTPAQPTDAAPQPVARPGVTPLHEAPPPMVGVGVEPESLPDIGHKEPLPGAAAPGEPRLVGSDGKPLPTQYTPPADTGVRVEPDGTLEAMSGAGAAAADGGEGVAPSAAASSAAGAPVDDETVPTTWARPGTIETGNPAPADPVPPIYSSNGMKSSGDVERPGSPTEGVTGPAPVVEAGTVDAELLSLVNGVRRQGSLCGKNFMPAVPALRDNPVVARAAAGYAADMRARGYFSPVSPEGRRAGNRLTDAGYAWAVLAENIISGTSSADAALQNWLKNESQCRNIMNPDYTEAGAGTAGGIRVLTLTAPLSGGGMRPE